MQPFQINGRIWRVVLVERDHPSLIDRDGIARIATTDPLTRTINLSKDIPLDMLDSVLLHEVSHAVFMSYGLFTPKSAIIRDKLIYSLDELSAQMLEDYAIEAIAAASQAIGRPLCVRGLCATAS